MRPEGDTFCSLKPFLTTSASPLNLAHAPHVQSAWSLALGQGTGRWKVSVKQWVDPVAHFENTGALHFRLASLNRGPGGWCCHPQWNHDWAALQGVGARALLGGSAGKVAMWKPRPPRHCHTGSEWHPPVRHSTVPVCALKPGLVLNAPLFIWLFLMLRFSVFPKKSNGCCFQKFT